eukprot:876254-Lingulodinium_polyedra.AAC.1
MTPAQLRWMSRAAFFAGRWRVILANDGGRAPPKRAMSRPRDSEMSCTSPARARLIHNACKTR